ncbi:MAG: PorT family protein [Saprospiraceae bacterium]|nr:PorT family protein [Saprospiraceae bacterium]
MKNIILFASLMLVATFTASAQFSLRPQIGYNSSTITKRFQDQQFGSEAGFQFGVDMQIGKKFYVQPGILWESANNELRDMINGNNTSFQVNRIRVPVMLGYKLIGPDAGGLIDARIFTGPNASFVINKDLKQSALINKDDFHNAVYGWNIGAGFDIAILFVDIGYSFGLSEVFDNAGSTARNNLFYANAGLRIGF